ncbi:MAG: hypothetical protein ACT4QG_09325 [Sporichthyaceae bacterium]
MPHKNSPTQDEFVRFGKIGGRSNAIGSIEQRVEKIVAEAPELTPQQTARLRAILSGALDRIGVVHGGAA